MTSENTKILVDDVIIENWHILLIMDYTITLEKNWAIEISRIIQLYWVAFLKLFHILRHTTVAINLKEKLVFYLRPFRHRNHYSYTTLIAWFASTSIPLPKFFQLSYLVLLLGRIFYLLISYFFIYV